MLSGTELVADRDLATSLDEPHIARFVVGDASRTGDTRHLELRRTRKAARLDLRGHVTGGRRGRAVRRDVGDAWTRNALRPSLLEPFLCVRWLLPPHPAHANVAAATAAITPPTRMATPQFA